MSVREAQLKIDSAEFTEWCAYSNIVPFYDNRTDYLLASMASILVNVNLKKGKKKLTPEDFLPRYKTRTRDTAEEIEIKLKAILNVNH